MSQSYIAAPWSERTRTAAQAKLMAPPAKKKFNKAWRQRRPESARPELRSPTFGRAKAPARLYQKTLAKTGNASRCAAGISEDARRRHIRSGISCCGFSAPRAIRRHGRLRSGKRVGDADGRRVPIPPVMPKGRGGWSKPPPYTRPQHVAGLFRISRPLAPPTSGIGSGLRPRGR